MPAECPTTTYGIVGFGRIGRRIAERLDGAAEGPVLAAVLVRPARAEQAAAIIGAERVVTSLDAFLARRPMIAVETASVALLPEIGPQILSAGIDLIPLSLAALADRAVEARMMAAAQAGPGRLEIPAGAVAALDFLAAAREEGLSDVLVRASYPTARLLGTRAETLADLSQVRARTILSQGSVRDLVLGFPNRVNVMVGVALAGLGLDRTRAELVADPSLTQAAFDIEAVAGPGLVRLSVGPRDVPLGADPVDYTTFSVLRLLRRRVARVAI